MAFIRCGCDDDADDDETRKSQTNPEQSEKIQFRAYEKSSKLGRMGAMNLRRDFYYAVGFCSFDAFIKCLRGVR